MSMWNDIFLSAVCPVGVIPNFPKSDMYRASGDILNSHPKEINSASADHLEHQLLASASLVAEAGCGRSLSCVEELLFLC